MSPKIIKNRADMLQKVGSQTMLQLASILDPTWLHFGKVLAPNLVPTWPQDALKIHSQTQQKTNHILDRFWTDFWWILASKLGPFWVHFRWILGLFLALGAILGQHGAHSRPRAPPAPILDDFGPQLGGFWAPTCWILAGFWIHLVWFLMQFAGWLAGSLLGCLAPLVSCTKDHS